MRDRPSELAHERARERDDRDRGRRAREVRGLFLGERGGWEPHHRLRRRRRRRPFQLGSECGQGIATGTTLRNRDQRPKRPPEERDVEPAVPDRGDDSGVRALRLQHEIDCDRAERMIADRHAHGVLVERRRAQRADRRRAH